MHVLITGAGGFLGQKLAKALIERGALSGQSLSGVTLMDLAAPPTPVSGIPVHSLAGDISDRAAVDLAFQPQPDVIFHLAAVVSGAAEADFDLGVRVNLMGTLNVLEAARQGAGRPVVVYASSIAVHGGAEPDIITDGVQVNPQTSYGAQKAMGELMVTDMSRKAFIDGRALRLPTVSIRPGKPNAAASSFMSSIFREPLQGADANCPVGRDFPVWHSAPRTVVANLIHGAEAPEEAFGFDRALNLPGRQDSIGAMIEAMTHVAGEDPAKRITWEPDPVVQSIVKGWRSDIRAERALAMGFKADASFEDSVQWFLEDDVVRPDL